MKRIISSLVLLWMSGIVSAHPLGIFSINRYTRIDLVGAKSLLTYVVDIAEIPSIQEFSKIDLNNDKIADEQERTNYVNEIIPLMKNGFRLTIDGKNIDLKMDRYELSFPEGQGGIKTIR